MSLELVKYDLRTENEALSKLFKEYFPDSPYLPDAKSLSHSSAVYFKCLRDGEQVGLTGYVLKTPFLAETVKTTVFTGHRNEGLGILISQAIEDECKRIGVKKVMTTIFTSNHAMISIKLKQGYTIEGHHPDHEAPGFDEYSLGKKL